MPHWTPEWPEYLTRFHHERPGVTENVLSRTFSGGRTPIDWLARAVSGHADIVLDIGCGGGAMSRTLARPGRTVIGVDISADELALAQGPGPWIQADARRLPIADASVDVVVSTLGLAVIHPLRTWLDEACRVLRPGGVLAALTPGLRPLSPRDAGVALGISARLHALPAYPVGMELASAPILARSGLRRTEDNRERFHFPVRSRADADLLLRALYLPGAEGERVPDTAAWLAREVRRRGQVLVPVAMRRIVAVKPRNAPRGEE